MREEEVRALPELAREVVADSPNALKIIIVKDAYLAGILETVLVKNHAIAKKDIAQLGYTASDEQNANLLRRRTSIVLVPEPILLNRPCEFHPREDTTTVSVFHLVDTHTSVERFASPGRPFNLKWSGNKFQLEPAPGSINLTFGLTSTTQKEEPSGDVEERIRRLRFLFLKIAIPAAVWAVLSFLLLDNVLSDAKPQGFLRILFSIFIISMGLSVLLAPIGLMLAVLAGTIIRTRDENTRLWKEQRARETVSDLRIPTNPQLASNLPLSALKHIIIYTDGDGKTIGDSLVAVGILQDTVGAALKDFGKVPYNVVARSDVARQIEKTSEFPESGWSAMAKIDSDATQKARAGLYGCVVRVFHDPVTRDKGAIVLLYMM